MRNRKKVLLITVFMAFGIILGSSNYQFVIEKIEKGTWVDLPVMIEKPPDVLAGVTSQYVDWTESVTYGTFSWGPPNGMGQDNDGPVGDTHLEEASYDGSGWANLAGASQYTGGTMPSGWSENEGGGALVTWGGTYASIGADSVGPDSAYFNTYTTDTGSYTDVRIKWEWKTFGEVVDASDFHVYSYEGSLLEVFVNTGSQPTWKAESFDRAWTGAGWYVRFLGEQLTWSLFPEGGGETIQIDNIDLEGYTSATYYRLDMVFRFDGVETGLAHYFLYVDFYTALTGSDDLDMYIETGDTTPDAFMCANDVQDDFSVNVTDYITGDTVYLRIFDDYRTGDTVFTDAIIQRVYLYTGVWDWNINGHVEIFFQVGWTPEFQFGYDAFFIFLGLIMIPTSTMYLVKGGRKEMSTDKLFYGLVIFVLGFGFLIGGILP